MSLLRLSALSIVACVALVWACSSPEPRFEAPWLELPADPAAYDPIASYEEMTIPEENPLTWEKASLGWQLYYDPRLSGDGVRSCYSCHVCENGLTDGRALAIGAFDKQLTRSSPSMWNVGYYGNLYWDGRAGSLEAQAKGAWTGGNMGAKDPEAIVVKLNQIEGYREQFLRVFNEPATVENVPMALATYMRTLIANNSRFDRWQAGETNATGTAAKRGWQLFQDFGCVECHAGVLFTDQQFHNVGIGMSAEDPDLGRGKRTGREQDTGAFKTPTLRDVSKSAPYFHDGSVPSLESAVRLMAEGGLDNPWLSTKLKKQKITDQQVSDIVSFLYSLDEPCVLSAPPLPK